MCPKTTFLHLSTWKVALVSPDSSVTSFGELPCRLLPPHCPQMALDGTDVLTAITLFYCPLKQGQRPFILTSCGVLCPKSNITDWQFGEKYTYIYISISLYMHVCMYLPLTCKIKTLIVQKEMLSNQTTEKHP